jgi:hypothetical protein
MMRVARGTGGSEILYYAIAKKIYFETWESLKEATNRKTKANCINSTKINGKPSDNTKEMSGEFNKFFSEVG